MSDTEIELFVDFNSEDDTGLSWTYADKAKDPSRIAPGRYVVAGMSGATAVVQIVDVGADGLVHVLPVPGSVEENRHLLDAQPSSA
jgi:hypothetical protein